MNKEHARVRLTHILQETEAILQVTKGKGLQDFQRIWLVRRAVQHGLMIVSEAAKHVPDELKQQYPEAPWESIRALGNVLRHEYMHIDDARVWEIVTTHLPQLSALVKRMLAELDA